MSGNDSTSVSQSAERRRITVAGASGTIGRAVVRALVADGHDVLALLREGAERPAQLSGAAIQAVEYADKQALNAIIAAHHTQTIISCLASRSGERKSAMAVDFQANCDLMKAGEDCGADHFILLSAICVQRPKLAFQTAKLAFESALKASPLDYTIVRPTAFFKSLSGQVDRVLAGKSFLIFGNGELTRCKPISDDDLARYIADCVTMPERRGAVLPIGGLGPAITPKQQGDLLFKAAGMEPQYRSVPVAMFSVAITVLSLGERFSNWFAQKCEYARIGRYYATQSMLWLNPDTGEYDAEATPEFGDDTLSDHYKSLIAERRTL